MARNKEFIDLKATSSKNLLRQFEAKRQRIVSERKKYEMEAAVANDKEKAERRVDEPESQLEMRATKGLKKSTSKRLDFSHLQSTFDSISHRTNSTPTTLEVQPNIPPQQPENKKRKELLTMPTAEKVKNGVQGGKSTQGLKKSKPTNMEADELTRKLEAIRKMNKDVSTSLSQERSCPSSTQLTINKGQQQNIQLTDEETQTGQVDTTLPSPETTPQNESAMLEQEISTKGKRMPGVKATTIDEFLKENGIDVKIEGPSTELSEDGEESMALDKDYYQHVMEEIDDEEGEPKKKKTRGKTTCKEIYARTMEQREEVTFDLGQPVGPTDESVSNLTSFVGTIGRNKRFVSLLYTSWHAIPPKAKKFMWDYVNVRHLVIINFNFFIQHKSI
ncbi:uncharacterized protein LOC127740634 isoform X1 [Arachis duranensis]|uniref:Uncharacterized protein LOC127740634 isoform X1 n=1 Tax=Arachis duranensis TaxID=130453 RepID=A0A9C6T648_ARADU|nr:uncharacterized protein LOC127740634 isoform X1 [Arachis duranensis]